MIVAVPLDGSAPVELVALSSDVGEWDVRNDNGAFVVSSTDRCTNIACASPPGRIAVVDLAAGTARWVTTPDGSAPGSPIWSPDGSFIYFGAVDSAQADLGIFRIRPDGSERTRVTDPIPPEVAPFGARSSSSRPLLVTTNNTLLWASIAGERTILRARDLITRSDATFPPDPSSNPCIDVFAWRPAPPSALVRHGSCQTQTAVLSLWNLGTGGASVVAGQPDWASDASFDGTGTKIVASLGRLPDFRFQLVAIDGNARTTIAGGDDAGELEWTSSGIVFLASVQTPPGCQFGQWDVRLVPASGGQPRTLYDGCGLTRLRVTPSR